MSAKNHRGVYWFRKDRYNPDGQFADDRPKWHLPARKYLPNGYYSHVEAVCGYKVESVLHRPRWSRALTLRGGTCSKCLKIYESMGPPQEEHHERSDTAP